MPRQRTYLVFGSTGQTGQHFVRLALADGHRVRVLARNPSKLDIEDTNLEITRGSITDDLDLDGLVRGADFVVSMLGDAALQAHARINEAFVRRLVPAMRRHGVARFLYQAGGLSRAPGRRLSPPLWLFRHTLASSYDGQHRDNEAVMEYLVREAGDLEWMAHRAGIGSDGPSKGVLERSASVPSIATFADCAAYSYRLLEDATAVHTCDFSRYRKG